MTSSAARPYQIAVVGAGPSGIYAAEALVQQTEVPVEVVVIDRLPTPFGLVRYGVAPDHASIRSIRSTLVHTLERSGVRFFGDVVVGRDLGVDELRASTDAVIYAYGAGADQRLGIPGEDLVGSVPAPELVAWYCGHPDVHPDPGGPVAATPGTVRSGLSTAELERVVVDSRSVAVIGVGNVALDVARVLVKDAEDLARSDMAEEVLEVLARSTVTDVHLVGRRGPAYTSFTTKELRELGLLDGVDLVLDPADFVFDESSRAVLAVQKVAARNVAVMQEWLGRPLTGAPRRIHLHFWQRPVALRETDTPGRVGALDVEATGLDADGRVTGTGRISTIPADAVVRSVGYRGVEIPGVPHDASTGRVPHAEGRVIRDGGFSPNEYVTGWIKRGPTGVIGTNKHDAVETVTGLLADIAAGRLRPGHDPAELTDLLAARGISPLGMDDWHRIDAVEVERGVTRGRPRTTLPRRADLLAAAQRGPEHPVVPGRSPAAR